ncbi:aquaporin [Nocardia sp. NPDC004722]
MSELKRRSLAEFVGTGLLVCVVVGSGIAAQQLSAHDVGLQLLENSTATVFGLAVLILVLGPVSGAHFNPVVSVADWWAGRRRGTGLTTREVAVYLGAQVPGGIAGAVLANIMFDQPAAQISTHHRVTTGHLVGEIVATAGLIAVIFALARTGRAALSALAVAAYIGSAYWFTSSTSFANPAVTVGRIFSDTFAGIAPTSAPAFIAAQFLGAALGFGLIWLLYPDPIPAENTAPTHPLDDPRSTS